MSWTVHFTKAGCDVVTRQVAYMGVAFLFPRSHGCVTWFTHSVFKIVQIDMATRTAVAAFSHNEKHHMDRPRNPARIPA